MAKNITRRGFIKGGLATSASTVLGKAAAVKETAEQFIRRQLRYDPKFFTPGYTPPQGYYDTVDDFINLIKQHAGSCEAWLADNGRRFVAMQYDIWRDIAVRGNGGPQEAIEVCIKIVGD